jgi:hypothetical protein
MSGDGAFSREIASSETVPECFTFGQDMPGTSCSEHYPGSATTLPCLDKQLTPKSIDVEGNCAFYSTPNCEGDSPTLTSPNTIDCLSGMDILSYKCVSIMRDGPHDVRVEANIVCSGLSRSVDFDEKVERNVLDRTNYLILTSCTTALTM